jgi:hypothetical protein
VCTTAVALCCRGVRRTTRGSGCALCVAATSTRQQWQREGHGGNLAGRVRVVWKHRLPEAPAHQIAHERGGVLDSQRDAEESLEALQRTGVVG